jgi:caa(3)-type oxidase subunit IV
MNEHSKRRPSSRDYALVFGGLAFLTALTVAISYTGLSEGARTVLALSIAGVKTTMVALIFMHLRFEKRPIVVFAIMPVLIALIFIAAISPDIGR